MFNPFKKVYNEKEFNFFRYLSRIRLFEKLTYKEMELFLPYFYLREYKMDEVVFFRNDPSNALYLVKSGKISLSVDVNDDFETLNIIKSGEAFGQNSMIKDGQRHYNAIVYSEKAELYVLPKVNLSEILSGHIKIKAKMFESYSEIHNDFNKNLIKGYKTSFGLFDLSKAYTS